MLRADSGDYLRYLVIAVLVVSAGSIGKYLEARQRRQDARRRQELQPEREQRHDDLEDEDHSPSPN